MAQNKQQILAALAESDMQPRHRFGQNFMIDQNMVRLIASSAGLSADDLVIEVGPGTGTLTEELLASGARVVAVEIDRDLAAGLRERFADRANFHLIEGDALAGKHELNGQLLEELRAFPLSNAKLVANLPYNIASPLVVELLLAGVALLVFTVQKEVADRMAARADTPQYGPLTVMVQLLAQVELLRTIPPQAFWPAPKIESALVKVVRADQIGAEARQFGRFMHGIFTFRRKTIRKALDQAGHDAAALLAAAGVDGQKRAECFTPAQLLALYHQTLPVPPAV